jgi:hypothetical protein
MTSAETTIRPATVADLDTIVRHRRRMFWEMGCREDEALDAMEATSTPSSRPASRMARIEDGWRRPQGERSQAVAW